MKSYRLSIRLSILTLVIFLSVSCSDFLKEEPYDFIGPELIGDSNDAVDLWVTGVYSKWGNDIFRWSNFPRVLDMDCDYTTGPNWAFSSMGAGNFQDGELAGSIWSGCYNLINRANVAIRYISAMSAADEEVKQNGLGELYFQKAFAYFLLTRAYGEIPLFDNAISDGADFEQPRRPIPEVYAEIVRLLEDAIPLLYKNTDPSFELGHVSAGSAAGLLAKVYATMAAGALPAGEQVTVKTGAAFEYNGSTKVLTYPVSKTFSKTQVAGYESFDWQDCYAKAALYAARVMGKDTEVSYGSYSLLPFDKLWQRSSYNTEEHLFMIQTLSGDEEYGNQVHRWYCGTESAGAIVSGQWIGNRFHWTSLFDTQDYRFSKGIKHRYQYNSQVSTSRAYYYPNTAEYKLKATGYDSNGVKVADPVAPYNDGLTYTTSISSTCLAYTTKYADVTDPSAARTDAYWPFLRLADVELIYAEAQCELNSGVSVDAVEALNEIRRRSNAVEAILSGDGAITTKVELRSAILEERAKELALEGDRRWDLIRWGIYLDVMNSVGGTAENGTHLTYDEASVNKYREQKHLLFPIPTDEVSSNGSITSNNIGWN